VHWDDLDVAARVRDMAERVWQQLQPLAEGAEEPPDVRAVLDAARAAYGELYAEAEAIAQTSIHAVRARRRPAESPPPGPPSLRVRLARRVPVHYRQQIRRMLGRSRPEGAAEPRT
jgi:hypothetical protein